MQVATAVCRVLKRAVCEGPIVRLNEDMEPAHDERVDKVLTASGASWSYRHKAYVFADLFPFGQAAPLIEEIITTRRTVLRPDRGVVSCPQSVAELICDDLPIQLQPGWQVLEPSAGHGILAAEAAARGCVVDCYEMEHWRAAEIKQAGFARHVITADFLTMPPRAVYDAVVMYPPYRRDLAAAHIVHAHRFLRPGGVLAALVSLGLENGHRRSSLDLRDLWARGGWFRRELERGDVLSPTGIPLRAEIWFLHAPE